MVHFRKMVTMCVYKKNKNECIFVGKFVEAIQNFELMDPNSQPFILEGVCFGKTQIIPRNNIPENENMKI